MFFVIKYTAIESRAPPWFLWKVSTESNILCFLTVVCKAPR